MILATRSLKPSRLPSFVVRGIYAPLSFGDTHGATCLPTDDCLLTDHPEKCRHKLASMPRWLSSAKVEVVRKLLAEDPAMLLRESLGISADGSEKAFAQRDVEDMLARQAPELEYSARDPRRNTQHVFLAVDPSGGGASAFSICSILQDANGFMHVRLRMHTNSNKLNPFTPPFAYPPPLQDPCPWAPRATTHTMCTRAPRAHRGFAPCQPQTRECTSEAHAS